MAALSLLEAAFTSRRTRGRWWQPVLAIVACFVLAGGIYPALYLNQLPHDHIFVGGAPPPNWEQHEHESALDYLFGRPDGDLLPLASPVAATTSAHPAAPRWTTGHVVSVYPAGGSLLVLTVVAYALIVPSLGRLAAPSPVRPVFRALSDLAPLVAGGPVPPPPRAR